jgi:hypothetical protein
MDEPVILYDDQADDLRRLLGTVEDRLLHTSPEVLDDLGGFLTGLSSVLAMVRAVPCRSLPRPHRVVARPAGIAGTSRRAPDPRFPLAEQRTQFRSGDRSPAEAESPNLARQTTEERHGRRRQGSA